MPLLKYEKEFLSSAGMQFPLEEGGPHSHSINSLLSQTRGALQPAASSAAESTESLCGSAQPQRSKPVGARRSKPVGARTERAHVHPG